MFLKMVLFKNRFVGVLDSETQYKFLVTLNLLLKNVIILFTDVSF